MSEGSVSEGSVSGDQLAARLHPLLGSKQLFRGSAGEEVVVFETTANVTAPGSQAWDWGCWVRKVDFEGRCLELLCHDVGEVDVEVRKKGSR